MTAFLARFRKLLVAVLGAAAEGVGLGLFHGTVLEIVNGALAVATALGVYAVPNAPKLKSTAP